MWRYRDLEIHLELTSKAGFHSKKKGGKNYGMQCAQFLPVQITNWIKSDLTLTFRPRFRSRTETIHIDDPRKKTA